MSGNSSQFLTPQTPSSVDLHVGARIGLRRAMLEMSREALATKLLLPVGVIEAFERGMVRVRARTLYDVSLALNVPVAFFFEGYELQAANDRLGNAPLSEAADD